MTLSRLLTATLVCVCLAGVTLAAPQRISPPGFEGTIVVPEGSPLVYTSFDKDNITAHFDGRVILTGRYYYGPSQYDSDMIVFFRPDKASKARLPYFQSYGPAGDIYLTNGADFVAAVMPGGAPKAASQKRPYATANVTIVVDRFEASIECDAPNYSARFVSLVKPTPVLMAALPDEGC